MRIDKNISIDGHNLLLSYNDSETDPTLIDDINCHRLIKITFIPNQRTNEREVGILFENYHGYLIEKIKEVVKYNQSFYDNFDVSFRFDGSGSTSVIEGGVKVLKEAHRYLKIRMKKKHELN